MPAGAIPSLGAVASVGGEEILAQASLWASYTTMGFKKTPPPASSATPSRLDRDRESSPPGGEGTGSAHDETSSSGNKEDEDDDDMDVDEGLDPRHHDPERLKAFNVSVTRRFAKFAFSNLESSFGNISVIESKTSKERCSILFSLSCVYVAKSENKDAR